MVAYQIMMEPNGGGLGSPYVWLASARPIYFRVMANTLVTSDQPMFADIYIGVFGGYYKTITGYSISSVGGTNSVYEFDIQDALQEYLQTRIPNDFFSQTNALPYHAALCYVKFRGSSFGVGGVVIPETPVPIQPTATTSGGAGGGLASNTFFVLKATLAPDAYTDNNLGLNQLEKVLSYKQIQGTTPFETWNVRIYPLSNLPKNNFCIPGTSTFVSQRTDICPEVYRGDSGLFPILILRFGIHGSTSRTARNCDVLLQLYNGGSSTAYATHTLYSQVFNTLACYYLPIGLKEIELYLGGSVVDTMTDPNSNTYYRLILGDSTGQQAFRTPLFKARNKAYPNPPGLGYLPYGGGENPINEVKRVWFQNYYGHFEQISFVRTSKKMTVKSGEQFSSYASNTDYYPYAWPTGVSADPTIMPTTGKRKNNVRSAEEITVTTLLPEGLMEWAKELMNTPFCLIDINPNLNDNTYNPEIPNSLLNGNYNFLPYMIEDTTFSTKKTMIEGRWFYELTVTLVESIETVQNRS